MYLLGRSCQSDRLHRLSLAFDFAVTSVLGALSAGVFTFSGVPTYRLYFVFAVMSGISFSCMVDQSLLRLLFCGSFAFWLVRI